MCGLSGILTLNNQIDIEELMRVCSKTQAHRGPDAQSFEVYNEGPWHIGFSHQRLSVIDLSDLGVQPMNSLSGRSSIVYNGEVYNYREIKEELNTDEYKSNTDTEVILNALEEKGIDLALSGFNGMWGFSWYDRSSKKLYLCRDRMGIKPLYYYSSGDSLYFASEIKTILEATQKKYQLNYQKAGEYLFQSLQDTNNETFYEEIYSVPPGCYLVIDLSSEQLALETVRYWDIANASPYEGDNLEATVKDIFNDAVKLRLRSDVPVGVTLSGGIDSSAIASAMKQHLGSTDNLNVLSAVSANKEMDESEFIDIMSTYLDVDATKVVLEWSPQEAVDLLKKVIWHNDTPVGSFSNVAHYLLMKKAHELGITVILSGQGADELLCGYKKYLAFYIQSLLRNGRFIQASKTLFQFLLNKSILLQFDFMEAKRYLPKFLQKERVDIKGDKLRDNYTPVNVSLKSGQSLIDRQIEDIQKFSVPFLTHYEDRMSMAWSREIRLPFLDYRLVELLTTLPPEKKLFSGWTKYIFRKAMSDMLPSAIAWRKDKQGFINPQERWLKEELKEEVLKAFSEDALIFSLGILDREALLKKYDEYCTQKAGKGTVWYREIFAPFALELWLKTNKDYLLNE